MNARHALVAALYTAHTIWKAKGTQSRALVSLIVELDVGRFLETDARDTICTDIANFAHVCALLQVNIKRL